MENVLNASKVKIHLQTCSVYQNNPNDTATSKWHKASSIAEAENIAKILPFITRNIPAKSIS